jgi:hypothetical protein
LTREINFLGMARDCEQVLRVAYLAGIVEPNPAVTAKIAKAQAPTYKQICNSSNAHHPALRITKKTTYKTALNLHMLMNPKVQQVPIIPYKIKLKQTSGACRTVGLPTFQ